MPWLVQAESHGTTVCRTLQRAELLAMAMPLMAITAVQLSEAEVDALYLRR